VNKGGTRYSPKFQAVLEPIKAEGKASEAQVAQAHEVHPVTLANGRSGSKRRKHGQANVRPSCFIYSASLITSNPSRILLAMALGVGYELTWVPSTRLGGFVVFRSWGPKSTLDPVPRTGSSGLAVF